MNPQDDRWLTEREAAAIFSLSTSWFQRARWSGSGPPFSKISRAVRYRLSDLIRFMEAHQRHEDPEGTEE